MDSRPDHDDEPGADAPTDPILASLLGPVRPDDSVLDELSRAFSGVDGTRESPGSSDSDAAPSHPSGDSFGEIRGRPSGAADTEPASRSTTDSLVTVSAGTTSVPAGPSADADGSAPRDLPTIAIGGADDLPDAVYLDEQSAGVDGSGGTVFIDDDGTGDAIATKDATSTGIEPRFRQRRIGVRRAENRRRLKWVALIAVALLVVIAVLTLLGSGFFAIDEVVVTGNVYTDENRLAVVVEELEGTPVLLADTDKAEADLEAIPWVEDARVRTQFPNGATIEIRERDPMAAMRGADGRFRVLDREGRVLDVIEGQPVAYVLIAGPGTLDLAAGEFASAGPAAAASLVTKLTPTIRPRVESIEVTDDGSDLVLNLAPAPESNQTSTIKVRFGSAIGDNDQIEKLVRLEKKLEDLPDVQIREINVATNEVTVL